MKKKRSTAYHVWLLILVVLFGLFAVQKRGTGGIGRFFGPITLVREAGKGNNNFFAARPYQGPIGAGARTIKTGAPIAIGKIADTPAADAVRLRGGQGRIARGIDPQPAHRCKHQQPGGKGNAERG